LKKVTLSSLDDSSKAGRSVKSIQTSVLYSGQEESIFNISSDSTYPSTDTTYGNVFVEKVDASLQISGCAASKCFTECDCNKDNGWYESAASANPTNTSNVYKVTSTRTYYGNSNETKTCYKSKANASSGTDTGTDTNTSSGTGTPVYFHVSECQINSGKCSFKYVLNTDSSTNTSGMTYTYTSIFNKTNTSAMAATFFTAFTSTPGGVVNNSVTFNDLKIPDKDPSGAWIDVKDITCEGDAVQYLGEWNLGKVAMSSSMKYDGGNYDVQLIPHDSCLSATNVCSSGQEYLLAAPNTSGFAFTKVTDYCYKVGCATGFRSVDSNTGAGTYVYTAPYSNNKYYCTWND
jgi:hypothetical protein